MAPFKPVQCRSQAQNIKVIRNAFAFPKQLCEWYNGSARRASPVNNIKPGDFIKACECVTVKHASREPAAFKAPDGFERKCNPAEHKRIMAIAKRQPKRFCDFWGKGEGYSFRVASPFQKEGISNMQIYNACACMEKPNEDPSAPSEDSVETGSTAIDGEGLGSGAQLDSTDRNK